jgi:hypothetical protein
VSRREDIDNSIWADPEFNALTPAGKLVYLWSFTNPRCNMAGLYKVPLGLVCAETGLTENRVRGAFAELEERRMVFYDGCALWVRARVKHLRSHHENIATSIVKGVRDFAGHPFHDGFWAEYAHHDWLTGAKARIADG